MLDFALEYRKAIDMISGDKNMELWEYKLNEREWKLTAQLHDVLKVSAFTR